jgi:hypothetical protein
MTRWLAKESGKQYYGTTMMMPHARKRVKPPESPTQGKKDSQPQACVDTFHGAYNYMNNLTNT